MENRFIKWARIKYTEKQRTMAIIPLGFIFLLIIPAVFSFASRIDRIIGIQKVITGAFGLVGAAVFVIIGLSFGFWSVKVEFIEGKGTPVPMMPTQKLITTGPFRYCRNPMALGAVCAYFGVVVYIGSLSSFILYLILVSMLIVYIKLVEEKELEARFGQDYLDYKKRVPFIIPRFHKTEL